MTKIVTFAAATAAALGAAGFAGADETRQLDAHEHGRSVLLMAVDGDVVTLRLEAPGFDIVGFEHEAKSDADRAAVEAAIAALEAPAALFELVGGDCAVSAAEANLIIDEHDDDDHDHDHGHDHGHDDHGHDDHGHDDHADHGHDDHDHAEATHSEFQAEISMTCASRDDATAFNASGFFDAFDGAEVLELTIVAASGARQYDLTAENDEAGLAGVL